MHTTTTAAPLTTAQRGRSLAAIVALTTHCAPGGAIRWREQGYLRRDRMLFVAATPGASLPADAAQAARDLDCDPIIAELTSDQPVTLRAGMRLWNRLFWRDGLTLWRDDTGGRCCLVDPRRSDEHIWLETGRIVAHEGLPWRSLEDRDLGYARAAAAYRQMVKEG